MIVMQSISAEEFPVLYKQLCRRLRLAPILEGATTWQGVDVSGKPDMQTREIMNVVMEISLPPGKPPSYLADCFHPDLPWADDHFEERVSGTPMNPGTQWEKWRMGSGARDFLQKNGMFNHNYMERLWPQLAYINDKIGPTKTPEEWREMSTVYRLFPGQTYMRGIRKIYGSLQSIPNLLASNPMARQAYLPMFFPEDTGSSERTPCSLGWHFIIRESKLHVNYYLRSCDLINHFKNDVYMTARLLFWVMEQVEKERRDSGSPPLPLNPGQLTIFITSLHAFRGQEHLL